jgi:calpain-15
LLEKSKIKFVDVDFPPDESSILGDSDKNLIDDTVNHWRRPSNIFDSGKPYFLIDRLNSKNIVLGKLLDHAFYSVVCTLTMTHPSLIERLFFNQKSINENGVYRLLLCKNGEWQTVTIDDYIPC